MKPVRAIPWSGAASADWALVQACTAGDDEACTRLVTDHQRMVYQLALHLLGEHQEALDLSQDVFLRVFRMLPQFRGQSSLKTWVYRIVVTQASNRQRWWRRRRRHQQIALEDHVAAHGELPDRRGYQRPDRALQRTETADRVWHALSELPFDQRVAVVLREIDGLSYDEIAGALDIAVGTVKSRLARARESLRAVLRES